MKRGKEKDNDDDEEEDIPRTPLAIPKASQFELRPRTQTSTPIVTFQSINKLLLKDRPARLRLEGILNDEWDAQIAFQQILILSAIDERETRVQLYDALEELAGYYQVLGREFTRS